MFSVRCEPRLSAVKKKNAVDIEGFRVQSEETSTSFKANLWFLRLCNVYIVPFTIYCSCGSGAVHQLRMNSPLETIKYLEK